MGKISSGPIPLIDLDEGLDTPLYEQLFDGLRTLIATQRMPPGARLPATRALARDLEVSRTTVLEAFRRLKTEGYVESRVGDGTYVSLTLPEQATRALTAALPASDSPNGRASGRISRRGVRLHAIGTAVLTRDVVRPFLPGVPALGEFPHRRWWDPLSARMHDVETDLLHYSDPAGYRPLRAAIAGQLRASRGVRCATDQVVVTTGSQQGLALLARLLLDPGQAAWLEDPGYLGARRALQAAGAEIIPVPVDSEGIDLAAGAARRPNPAVIYVTPSHQFPLGGTMSNARRRELLAWASTHGAWVVEDDYDGEYRFEGRPLPALQGLDESGSVIYVGTMSKILFPSLRLGYVVLPPELVEPFLALRVVSEEAPSPVLQTVAAEFITGGDFARHVRRMRALYKERRDALLEALDRECGELMAVGPADAGMHLSATLPDDIDASAVSKACDARGVTALTISTFALHETGPNGLVLGFAGYSPGAIRHATRILADVIRTRAARK